MSEKLYYPCIYNNVTARIDIIVGKAMPRNKAETFLERNYKKLWLSCDAIPKPINKIPKEG